jgi:hypothetical protein
LKEDNMITIDGIRYIRLADVLQKARRLCAFVNEEALRDENGKYVDPIDEATIHAYNRLFQEIAGDEVSGDTREESKKLLLELEREYYLRRYAVTMKDDEGTYYFRKMCAGALEARMKQEGKSDEEIQQALEDGETLPVFSSDKKLAEVLDDYYIAEIIKKRCEDEGLTVEIVPAIYTANGKFTKYWLDSLFSTSDDKVDKE